MKSLKESLFDDDLITKEFKLRDAYDLSDYDNTNGGVTWYFDSFGENINNFKPFDYKILNILPHSYIDFLTRIIGDQPIPSIKDLKLNEKSKWSRNLKKELKKYVLPPQLNRFNKNFHVYLSLYEKDDVQLLVIRLVDGIYTPRVGLVEITFEPRDGVSVYSI